MRVAALQLGPASRTIAATTDRIVALMAEASARGVCLGVLPELSLTPYFAAAVHDDLDRFTSPQQNAEALDRISAAASELGLAIVVSYAEETNAGLFNSMGFYDRHGEGVGKFRKIHIPGQTIPKDDGSLTILEKRYFQPGNLGFGVFDLGVARAGGLICYDRRFPEAYRSLANHGADLICVGYNTPVTKANTLSEARRSSELSICGGAYSTATYAIATGKAGVEGGTRFIGGSFICSPEGRIIAKARTQKDEVVAAEIDLAHQAKVRARWSFDANRRPSEYVMTA